MRNPFSQTINVHTAPRIRLASSRNDSAESPISGIQGASYSINNASSASLVYDRYSRGLPNNFASGRPMASSALNPNSHVASPNNSSETPTVSNNDVGTNNRHAAASGLATVLPQRRSGTHSGPGTVNPSIHPHFRSKAVCELFCRSCGSLMCVRGMRAILLGNTEIELYSTDIPPEGVQLVYQDYRTENCACRIQDAACLGCGNTVGYHVTQPCEKCLEACNNGHFWMFLSDCVQPIERLDKLCGKVLRWATLPHIEEEKPVDKKTNVVMYERMCR